MATRHGTITVRAGEFTATMAVHPVTSYTWSPTTTFVSAVPMRDNEVPSHILRYGMPTWSGVRPIYRRGSRPFPVSH